MVSSQSIAGDVSWGTAEPVKPVSRRERAAGVRMTG